MRLGNRQRSRVQGSEPPIFSDAHSMEGEESMNPGGTSAPTFSARIIVSDGSSNPCVSGEGGQEPPAVDTTLRMEDCSDCSSEGAGNELVVITSAVIESDPEDVEAAPVVEDANLSEKSDQQTNEKDPSFKGGKGKVVCLCILLVLLAVAAVVAAVKLLAIGEDKPLDEELLEGEASASHAGISPSSSPLWTASNGTLGLDLGDLEVEEDTIFAVTSDPSYTPTPAPSVAPTTKQLTIAPTATQTFLLTSLPTQLATTSQSVPSSVETLAPTEATTTLGTTDTTSVSPTNEPLRFHFN